MKKAGFVMISDEKIKRLNELTKIAKTRAMTQTELNERERLRREFIDSVKENVRAHLDSIKVQKDN